ncbi:guanine nucleotide exchange factor for Rab-3A-like, partial [Sinocyclocheilus rhinocerous]|uniref:guanine nucleotide exchange factor for Rab-3A-like n=1 Tax=Sinocyclocheilus rhinocerous TaxID=307959 RepID=UPI0007B8BFD3
MDAFEGIHRVQLSSSTPARSRSVPGYEVLVAGNSGIAVYSSPTFFGKGDFTDQHTAEKERCPVGRLVDLEPDLRPGLGGDVGQREKMPPEEEEEAGAHRRETYNMSRLRSSSLEIKEKGTEFLREQLDAAQKELKLKDEECVKLSHVRNQLEQELEELTASLFEEAHKMVREANVKQAAAEKQLKEAQGKLDSVLFAEFLSWKEAPSLDRSSAFISRVYREDIGPCLSFTCSELSQSVQCAVENNSLTIEPVAMSSLHTVKALECGGPNGCRTPIETKCALSGMSRPCRHRIKLGDKENYYYISPSSRARITAVCNFFTY